METIEQKDQHERAVERIKSEIDYLLSQIRDLQEEITARDQQIDKLEEDVAELESENNIYKDRFDLPMNFSQMLKD